MCNTASSLFFIVLQGRVYEDFHKLAHQYHGYCSFGEVVDPAVAEWLCYRNFTVATSWTNLGPYIQLLLL